MQGVWKPPRVIEVVLNGRLGNWLFEYAAGRALALRRGTTLRLNLSHKRRLLDWRASWVVAQLRRFSLEAELSTRAPGRGLHPYEEPSLEFSSAVLDLPNDTCLNGYFQSERYFQAIASTIRRELVITPPNDAATAAVEARIAACISVAVHVRRTDYLRIGRDLLDLAWYATAMQHCREQHEACRFFVFSDDPAWCRSHFTQADCEVVDLPLSKRDPVNDLRLMTLCRHHIIANSTYSWWGAWLASSPEKTVRAPSRWLPDSKGDAQLMATLLPPQWIRVENGTFPADGAARGHR